MELWIRSQDKTTLIKVNKIKKYDKYSQKKEAQNYMPKNATRYEEMQKVTTYVNDKYLGTIIFANDVEVGEYKTKERALEVLNEIQNKLMPMIHYEPIIREKVDYSLPYVETEQIGSKVKIQELSTYVYEMPKE